MHWPFSATLFCPNAENDIPIFLSLILPVFSQRDLGLDLFRKQVLGTPADHLSQVLTESICHQMNLDRAAQSIPTSLIQSISKLLLATVGLEGFEERILKPFISATEEFYNEQGQRLSAEVQSDVLTVGGPSGYLRHSLSTIDGETERLVKFFTTSDRTTNTQTEKAIVQHVETNLIVKHLETLLQKGLAGMLEAFPDSDASQSISDLYSSLRNLGKDSVQRLQISFSKWMKYTGSQMVGAESVKSEEREKQDEEMVENLISFKMKMDNVVQRCFDTDREMMYTIKEAFETFINQRHNKPAELIGKYSSNL